MNIHYWSLLQCPTGRSDKRKIYYLKTLHLSGNDFKRVIPDVRNRLVGVRENNNNNKRSVYLYIYMYK